MGIVKKIGVDNSNSSFKAAWEGHLLNYTNTVSEVRESNTNRVQNKMAFSRQDVFEYKGKKYTVGSIDGIGSGSKDETRYYSDQFKLETALGLAQLVKIEKSDFNAKTEELKIMIGVPANLSERDDVIQKMKNKLIDEYEVVHNNVRKNFVISEVGVVSQPAAAYFYAAAIQKIIRTSQDVLLMDLGYGTFDMVELFAGKLGNNKTLDIAMSDYVSALYDLIEHEIPETRLSYAIKNPYELDKKLRKTDILEVPRGTFNVRHIKERLQEQMAQQIKSDIGKLGYNLEKYYKIILAGGGSILLEKHIRKVFDNDTRIVLLDEPVLAIVLGLEWIAQKTYGERTC